MKTIEEILNEIFLLIPPVPSAGWIRKQDEGDLKIYELRIPKEGLKDSVQADTAIDESRGVT